MTGMTTVDPEFRAWLKFRGLPPGTSFAKLIEVERTQAGLAATFDMMPQRSPTDAGRNDWIQTFTGRAVYPLSAAPDDIDIRDIAHALSLLCRYGGHVQRMYSVAEHCVLMSQAVSPGNALWALLHDATEGYLQDLVRPVKLMMPTYQVAENRLAAVICTRFGLPTKCPAEVKTADTRILLDERAALMSPSPRPWTSLDGLTPLGVPVEGWEPGYAEYRYLHRFTELTS